MFIIKLKSGEMYKFENESQVKVSVDEYRRQGVRGNVYQLWGKSRYQIAHF